MAPKMSKGKGASKASEGEEVPESEPVRMRREHVVFAPTVDAHAQGLILVHVGERGDGAPSHPCHPSFSCQARLR